MSPMLVAFLILSRYSWTVRPPLIKVSLYNITPAIIVDKTLTNVALYTSFNPKEDTFLKEKMYKKIINQPLSSIYDSYIVNLE